MCKVTAHFCDVSYFTYICEIFAVSKKEIHLPNHQNCYELRCEILCPQKVSFGDRDDHISWKSFETAVSPKRDGENC